MINVGQIRIRRPLFKVALILDGHVLESGHFSPSAALKMFGRRENPDLIRVNGLFSWMLLFVSCRPS